MTTTTTTDLAVVLDRVHRAVFDADSVKADGRRYDPWTEVKTIAGELGYAHETTPTKSPTWDDLVGRFIADSQKADWDRNVRLAVLLGVLQKAGAHPADIETLRCALGVYDHDLLAFIDE